jgi:hypothetical protein
VTIIVLGEPHDVLPLVEQLAADYGGVKEMRMNSFEVLAECEDGSRIIACLPAASRGHKADEVWVPSAMDHELLNNIVIPIVMGRSNNIHYFSEKGF